MEILHLLCTDITVDRYLTGAPVRHTEGYEHVHQRPGRVRS